MTISRSVLELIGRTPMVKTERLDAGRSVDAVGMKECSFRHRWAIVTLEVMLG